MKQLILAINPGSTSTKIGLFENCTAVFETTLRHSSEDLGVFSAIADQFGFRKKAVLNELQSRNININEIKIIMGRGGIMQPIPSGIYAVNSKMKEDLLTAKYGEHASNLGALIADDLAKEIKDCSAYITDPPVVDELDPVARISGHPLFERISQFHALNQKAVARRHSSEVRTPYEHLNLIVAHLGGGISVGAHKQGKVVDVNQALDGEGPFSPERSGTLPAGALAKLCFSGQYSYAQVKKMITGQGGLVAYLGTNDCRTAAEKAAAGDKNARLILDAMIYQIAKEIGSMAVVLDGRIDGILITGGIAFDKALTQKLEEKVSFLGKVFVYPGEDELQALAAAGELILCGRAEVKDY